MNALATLIALNGRREGVDLMQIELLVDIVRQLGEHASGNLLVSHFDLCHLALGNVVVVVLHPLDRKKRTDQYVEDDLLFLCR